MNIGSSSSIIAASNQVLLRPKTNGTLINFGAVDATGTLGLTDSELDRITANTIIIGDANSGTITTSSSISRAAATNIALKSRGAISTNPGSIDTHSGTMLLDAGVGGIQPVSSGPDIIASSVSFASGVSLAIQIDGPTVDSQYRQLNVTSSVNLIGASLSVTSNFPSIVGNEVFTIISATTGLIGTFSNFPVGSQVVIGSLNYAIHYNANSVVVIRVPSAIHEAYLFYKDSAYQTAFGVGGAIDPMNDGANPEGKDLLQSGTTAQATGIINVSNYSRGINGLVFDVRNLGTSTLSASDFVFRRPLSRESSILVRGLASFRHRQQSM